MNYPIIIPLMLCSSLLLSACGGSTEEEAVPPVVETQSKKTPTPLPEDAPALGTAVSELVKPEATPSNTKDTPAYQTLSWDDLVPENYRPDKVLGKYQAQITAAAEGSPEERALYAKVMEELNSAEGNPALDGKTVRIPGFIAPLDTHQKMVGDFLLVPYFGSCIHSPPPPMNQTVLVSPEADKSVLMDDVYRPVWVIGELKVESTKTDLAMAGYQIENARLELYKKPNK